VLLEFNTACFSIVGTVELGLQDETVLITGEVTLKKCIFLQQ